MTTVTSLPSGGAAIFWGVLTFSLLVVMHEGGHFLAARAFGVKVHEFMLGLPGPAIRWRSKRSGVSYGITAIPLGGYVRIAGMEPGAEDELLGRALGLLVDHGGTDALTLASEMGVPRERAAALLATLEDYGAAEPSSDDASSKPLVERLPGEDDDALIARVRSTVFRGQRTWKRMTILAMGVIVNIVAAIVILTVALTIIGTPVPLPRVKQLTPAGAAAAAGLRVGDTVTAFARTPIKDWTGLTTALKSSKPGTQLPITVRRDGRTLTLPVTLGARQGGGALLGVIADTRNVPVPVFSAFEESLGMTGAVFVGVGRFFNPSTFSQSLQGARSVVGISYLVAGAAEQGPLAYAWMIALLSLSLGVVNVLPIPPLDGGRIAVEAVGAAIRRPVPRNLAIAVSAAGTLLLFSLIFYLMYADVLRYIINKG